MVYPNLLLQLGGHYQKENLQTVLQALEFLKHPYGITDKHLLEGLKNVRTLTKFMGRWQILGENPLTIAESAHNEAGIKTVLQQVEQYSYRQLHFVYGTVHDKDISKILALLPKSASYYFAKANIPRGLDATALQENAAKHRLYGEAWPTVAAALEAAKSNAQIDDLILISGSIFVVAEVL